MRKALVVASLLFAAAVSGAAQTASTAATSSPTPLPTWREKVADAMPLLGHRNMILVVDSA